MLSLACLFRITQIIAHPSVYVNVMISGVVEYPIFGAIFSIDVNNFQVSLFVILLLKFLLSVWPFTGVLRYKRSVLFSDDYNVVFEIILFVGFHNEIDRREQRTFSLPAGPRLKKNKKKQKFRHFNIFLTQHDELKKPNPKPNVYLVQYNCVVCVQ